jgi:hypothetical protein
MRTPERRQQEWKRRDDRTFLIVILAIVGLVFAFAITGKCATLDAGLVYYVGTADSTRQRVIAERYDHGITGIELTTCDDISALDPAFRWYVYNSASDTYVNGPEHAKLEQIAAARGWSPDVAYLHYAEPTRIAADGDTFDIPAGGLMPFYLSTYPANPRGAVNFSTWQARQLNKEVCIAVGCDVPFKSSTLYADGIFFDNAGCAGRKCGEIISGGHVLEAPGIVAGTPEFQEWYWSGLRIFLSAVRDTLANALPPKYLVENVASHWTDDYATWHTADILFMEFGPNPITAPGADKPLEMYRRSSLAADAGMRLWYSPSASTCHKTFCHSYADAFMGSAAAYFVSKCDGDLFYLQATGNPKAAGWDTLTWRGLLETARDSLGCVIREPFVLQSGTDPAGNPYSVWAREYEHGLAIVRYRGRPIEDISEGTRVTVSLPAEYRQVDIDGEPGPIVCLASLRNGDGAILLRAEPEPTACDIRGHVVTRGTITDMQTEERLVDEPERSLYIRWNPNTLTGACMRCGRTATVPVQAKPDTVEIWRAQ